MAEKGKTAKNEDIGWSEMGWLERVFFCGGMMIAAVGFILWMLWNIFWPIFCLLLNLTWGFIGGVLGGLLLGGRK